MAEGPISEPRVTDPLLGCLGQMAERFGVSFAPSMLASLARGADRLLPRHQAEPAATPGTRQDVESERARHQGRRGPHAYPIG